MISPGSIQTIIETARIEEVVGEYVALKKRGINLIGLCPFHNEKTPSFTVSPTKGIYKCFGCGKGGNSVNFMMELEHYSYPEALRFLAHKYNIELDEEVPTAEQMAALDERETLFNICTFAQKHFTDTLINKDEGKAVGLSYFKEREFTDATIESFQLGYCSEKWDDFTQYALKNGYKIEQLVSAGFSIDKEGRQFDRFRGRVMFPIHNLSGKVIGFGGRILITDKTKSKYINSPETDIYSKSKVLYGLYYAKNAVIANDNCYLVEGYTDVITMHQAGILNVVASSGTSLTTEQIRLISRYTKNITILYDGDAAGIKASFRGLDMILEQGMNVKIVLFPDGEDPDSYTRKNRSAEVVEYITKSANNFILFKTNLLLEEAAHDPIKKSLLIKEIVQTIALIPDVIQRSVYIKECSALMDIQEDTLLNELNKLIRKKFSKESQAPEDEYIPEPTEYAAPKQHDEVELDDSIYQEKDIVRLLLNYGTHELDNSYVNEDNEKVESKISVAAYIVNDIANDEMKFKNQSYQLIFEEFVKIIGTETLPDEQYFTHHENTEIRNTAIDLLSFPHHLSDNWENLHRISVPSEDRQTILELSVKNSLLSFKLKKVEDMLTENAKLIKECADDEDLILNMERQKRLLDVKKAISLLLKRIITK